MRLEVALRFPCAFLVGISLPFHEISIVPIALTPVPENLLDLVLAIIIGFGQRCRFPRARDLNLLIYKYRYSVLLAIACMQLVSRARAAGMRDSCAWYPYTMRMI